MLTNITALSAKDLHHLQPAKSLSWAKRQFQSIKDSCKSSIVCAKHIAEYWSLPEGDILANLRGRYVL